MNAHNVRLTTVAIIAVVAVACSSSQTSRVTASQTREDSEAGLEPATPEAREAVPGDPQAIERCVDSAGLSGQAVVAGGYTQTIGDVEEWVTRDLRAKAAQSGVPAPGLPQASGGTRDRTTVVAVCWVDGEVAKSGPAPTDGRAPLSFDRTVFLLHPDGTKQVLFVTGSERSVVVRPSEGARS